MKRKQSVTRRRVSPRLAMNGQSERDTRAHHWYMLLATPHHWYTIGTQCCTTPGYHTAPGHIILVHGKTQHQGTPLLHQCMVLYHLVHLATILCSVTLQFSCTTVEVTGGVLQSINGSNSGSVTRIWDKNKKNRGSAQPSTQFALSTLSLTPPAKHLNLGF